MPNQTNASVTEASRQFVATADRLPTLYSLEAQAMELMGLLEDVDSERAGLREAGFVAEDIDAELKGQLALVDQMLMDKVEGYVSVIRSLESMAEARKAEADRLRDRAKTAERHADWLKERLLSHMQATGQPRIETVRFTLTVRANPGRVEVYDPAKVPGEYQKTVVTTTVDKRAVLDAMKRDGLVVPGCELVTSSRLAIA